MTDEIVITLGKVPSLNAFYSSKHWIFRKKAKDEWVGAVTSQLDKYDLIEFDKVSVTILSNYRYDIDNCIMASKFTMDALKRTGFIQDDSLKYFKKLTIKQDTTLEKNTAKIIIRELQD